MKTLITPILSWLLHHANRNTSSTHFYAIKQKLLAKYGHSAGYDVQFIQGKKCHTCNGTGVYTGYYFESGEQWEDCCNRCYGGWYKRPVWNILERVKFGDYIFHQPKERVYKQPEISPQGLIQGYISKPPTKHGDMALTILFLLYDNGYLKRWYNEAGMGWRCAWWLPRNYLRNIIHFYKHGRKSYPLIRFMEWYNAEPVLPHKVEYRYVDPESLPF